MQPKCDAQEDTPKHPGPSTDGEQRQGEQYERNPVVAIQPEVETVLLQIGYVPSEQLGLPVGACSVNDPSRMRPPPALARRVWIAGSVGDLVVHTMCGDPYQRPSFETQRRTYGKGMFQPFWRLVSAMRQQAVIAHADAEVDGNDMQDNQEEKHMPTEEEQRRDCAHVKDEHESEDGPIECARLRGAAEGLRLMLLRSCVGCRFRFGGVHPAADGVNGAGLVDKSG